MDMVNDLVSNCPYCMKLIRLIALDGIKYNRKVFVLHVRSKKKVLADALSRQDFFWFWDNAPSNMDGEPTKIPTQIWPVEKIWFDEGL